MILSYLRTDIADEDRIMKRQNHSQQDLSFFKENSDSHPDKCHALLDLLAWRGLESPLYELAGSISSRRSKSHWTGAS
jgi:hypothetical protein